MKKLTLLPLLLLAFAASAQNDLASVVDEIQNETSFRHASLSVSVYNISRQQTLYEHDAQRSLSPASLNKLFTTAVGFEKLGSDFRFKTTLAYSGEIDQEGTLHGNIYIIGGGDPLLGSYRFRQTVPDSVFAAWKKAIASQGIQRVDGRVCYDATIFDDQPLHDSWQWGDIGNYYSSGVCGLNFHENMYFLYFNPSDKLSHPAEIASTSPANIDVRHRNEVLTGSASSGDQVIVYGSPNSRERYCRGSVPLGKPNFPIRASLPHPAETCATLFASYLRNHGINVGASVSESYAKQNELKPIIDFNSNTYYIIAQYTNLTSNNMYAESIFKYLGYSLYGSGTYQNGAKAIADFFKAHNLENSGVRVVDGSGLSRLNRVTADFVCRFLTEVSHMPIYNDFSMSLGKIGESGTVRNMLKDLPANVDMRVKSGSMDDVVGYAGYVATPKGELLCFSIVTNGFDCSSRQAKQKLERIVYEIAKL